MKKKCCDNAECDLFDCDKCHAEIDLDEAKECQCDRCVQRLVGEAEWLKDSMEDR